MNNEKSIFYRLKNTLENILFEQDESDTKENIEKRIINPFSRSKNKIKLYEKNEIIYKTKEKKYISRNRAIEIADYEKNLRKSMYIEAKREGHFYGLIEINDYFATLIKFKSEYAWLIKIKKGKYIEKVNSKYQKNYYNEDSNIGCLIMAQTGEYIYLGTDFDTRNFSMVTDDEFLEYINNVRH